jgi:hypothetical protein
MQTFQDRVNLVEQTEALLKDRGINVTHGSLLWSAFDTVRQDLELHENRDLIDGRRDLRPLSRISFGTVVICMRLLRAAELGLLSPAFDPHLRLLANSLPSQSSPYSDIESLNQVEEENSNKLFELVVGLAAAEAGTDVQFEQGNGTDNPDVLVTIDNERWGFPCKVVKSYQMRTLMSRIDEGLAQLYTSQATRGCVIANLKNIFPHDELNPLVGTESPEGFEYRAFDKDGVDKFIH